MGYIYENKIYKKTIHSVSKQKYIYIYILKNNPYINSMISIAPFSTRNPFPTTTTTKP